MKMPFIGIYLGFLLMIPLIGISQETRILILDKVSKDPVAFANVVLEPIENSTAVTGYVSDVSGIVVADISQKSILKLSYIGFMDYADTIYPGEDKTIYLKTISYNVDEVVVTGQYSASTQDKSIYKVKVLNSKEIEQRAAVNIKDMLAAELNIRTSHNILGSTITMQGLAGEHIKFLVDGVPVIGREAGNIDLDQINLQNIDHVEIINGPMSVVYGSNALAGVINIITKESDRLLFSSNVDAYHESVGVYNINGGASARLKRNSISINGGRNFFDGFSPVDTGRRQQWKPKEQWNFGADYKYRWDNAFVKLGASWFSQELRNKGTLLPKYYEYAFDSYYYTKRLVLRTDFKYEFSSKSRINAIASLSKYSKKKNTYMNNLTILEMKPVPSQQDTTLFDNIMFRADYSYGKESSMFRFQTGVDLNNEVGFGKRIRDKEQQIGDYAAFMSFKYSPVNVLDIQPGLRFIYNTKYEAPVIYSLNVKYNITEQIILRASLASGFRAPSLKELYLDFVDINHNIHGNENLKAENSVNTNVLLQYNSLQKNAYTWGVELNLFNNDIKDNIKLVPQIGNDPSPSPPAPYTYVNISRLISRGVEFNFNNKIHPQLSLKFGVTFTGLKMDYTGENKVGFAYYTDFSSSLNYLFRKYDVNFSVYYKYNDKHPELYIFSANEDSKLLFMDPYNTLDINISKWFWKRKVNFQIGGKNLFNNTNINVPGDDPKAVNWGRTFFVRLQFKFNK